MVDYSKFSKDELIAKLDTRAKNGKKTIIKTFLPVNSDGIKVTTLSTELGVIGMVVEDVQGDSALNMAKAGAYRSAGKKMLYNLDPRNKQATSGMFMIAIGTKAISWITKKKKLGILNAG